MPHMLYDPTDKEFIEGTLEFFLHLRVCDECAQKAKEEGAAQIAAVFNLLNHIFMHPTLEVGQYAEACHMCEGWLGIHEVLTLVDAVVVLGDADEATLQ